MEYYLMIARSVTYAQRMRSSLEESGIHCRIFRAPRELTKTGCAYAVQLPSEDLPEALAALERDHLAPTQAFAVQDGFYQEVAL